MPVPAAKLKIEKPGEPLREFLLEQSLVTVGNDPESTLVLTGNDISQQHCQIVWDSDHYAIADLESASGTWVNGNQLLPHTFSPLQHGDKMQVGHWTLSFHSPPTETVSALPGTVLIARTLVLQVSTATTGQEFPLDKEILLLGCAPDSDIRIDLSPVDYRHAQLSRSNGSYEITNLSSSNNLLLHGQPISQHLIQDGDVIQIGEEITLTFRVIHPGEPDVPVAELSGQLMPLDLQGRTRITLGRDPSNDIPLNHPTVSRFHARLDQLASGVWRIRDLKSSNSTFINGEQIFEPQPLSARDTIQIGPYHLVFNPDGTLLFENEAGNLRLDALHLFKTTHKGVCLLNDISLSILPREFVAIVGGSGTGKSTLLDALNGFRPARRGLVLVNGTNLYANFNVYRMQVGYVPQDDIIHQELTVGQALDYAARLRLPPDTTSLERQDAVQSVLSNLELTHRQHVLVKNLSGGQRKRVSIGVELLTKPSLFFLDEATSGLDPGTETQMMRLLRKLADQGRTILLITHATKNVMMSDLVVFLAKGGRIAYFGPPEEALSYFKVKDFDEIYLQIENQLTPQEWQDKYLNSRQYRKYVVERQSLLRPDSLAGQQTPSGQFSTLGRGLRRLLDRRQTHATQPLPSQSQSVPSWRQFLILTQRNLTILLQDRASLILMLALAPILGLLDFVMWKRYLFDSTRGDAGQSFTMSFIAVLIAVMVGSLATMREIVKEAEIYRRERMVGLRILSYVLSKMGLGVVLAIYQSAIFLLTKSLAIDNLATGPITIASLYITLLLSTMGGMVMGLLVSSLSTSQNVAPLLTILFLVPQITFAGAILPLRDFGLAGQVISQMTITRWGFETMVTLTRIGKDVAEDPCWQLPEAKRDNLTESEKEACQCLGPNLFQTCNFPGVRKEYDPAVAQPEPVRPKAPDDPPAIPDNPLDPDFRDALDQLDVYRKEVEAYNKAIDPWQKDFTNWKEKRGTAIASGEALIKRFHHNQGDTFKVNVLEHWGRMLLIMLVMLGLLLVVQKRKDII